MDFKDNIILNTLNIIGKQQRAKKISDDDKADIYKSIKDDICVINKHKSLRIKMYLSVLSVAAVAIFAIVLFPMLHNHQVDYNDIIASGAKYRSDEFIVIHNDDIYLELKKDAKIEYTIKGELVVNGVKVNQKSTHQPTHIMTPVGLVASIVLSDGTAVTINESSNFIYRAEFLSDLREVYLEGEGYFDVAKDVKAPFVVRSFDFDVNVTGTKFNVKSFDADNSSVVLVSGGVIVNQAGSTIELTPNERVDLTGSNMVKSIVKNTSLYTCWQDKIMVFDNASLSDVLDGVSNYYDIDITVSSNIQDVVVSGKLDLNDDVNEVVETLELLSKMKATTSNNHISFHNL